MTRAAGGRRRRAGAAARRRDGGARTHGREAAPLGAGAGPETPGELGRAALVALLLLIAGLTLWIRLTPLALPGLDAETRALLTYEGADGRAHVYLGDYDSYVWLRAARTYLRTGTVCDAVEDGVCRDTLTHAPVGRAMRYGRSLHVAAIVGLHRLVTLVVPDYPLPATAYLVPVLVGTLALLPAFGIGRRLGGVVAGLAAAAAVALNPFFFSRTAGGDNEVWNVVLPLALVWAIARALAAGAAWTRVAWTAVAAGFAGLHAAAWSGWIVTYGVVLAGLAAYAAAAALAALRAGAPGARAWAAARPAAGVAAVFYAGCLATTALAGSERSYFLIPLELLGDVALVAGAQAAEPRGLHWLDVFATVGELYDPAGAEVTSALGGLPAHAAAWIGLALLLLPGRGWRRRHVALAAVGLGAVGAQLFGGERWNAALLAVPPAAALAARVALDADLEREPDLALRVVAAVWLLAGAVLAARGARFVLLLIAPVGLVFGHVFGRVRVALGSVAGRAAAPLALAVLAVVLAPMFRLTSLVAATHHPRMHDAWWDTFAELRERAPAAAVLHLWWDYGYWAKYAAERRVSADGGSLQTRIPYWEAQALAAADERQAVGLLRMLSCGSAAEPEPEGAAGAYATLRRHGLGARDAYGAVLTLAALDAGAAESRLAARGLAADARRAVLAATHCVPDPAYLVLGSTQLQSVGWKALGLWDPRDPPAAPLAPWRRELLTYAWVPCRVAADGGWTCPLREPADRGRSALRAITLDPAAPASARLEFAGDTGVLAPAVVVLATADARREVALGGARAPFGVLADLPNARVLAGAPAILRSTFVHLMLLDGRYARRFEKTGDRTGFGGERVVTWRIRWDAGEGGA